MVFDWFKKKKNQPANTEEEAAPPAPAPAPAEAEDRPPAPATGEDHAGAPPASGQPESPAPADAPAPPESAAAVNEKGFMARLKRGLSKTRDFLNTDIEDLFRGKNVVDDAMLEEIEGLLIASDMGVQTVMDLMEAVRRKASKVESPAALKKLLKEKILSLLENASPAAAPPFLSKPHVVMVVGVNGVGKTTTIGKLAAISTQQGQKVLIAAADTFRAAAVEQLAVWAERAGAEIVRHKENADPAAVAFDGLQASLARRIDTVFVDTAGRLHTKVNLMEELKKIQRTLKKKIPEAPHEVLLVLDATTGQNAVSQARMFHEALGVTGLVLTKLDGTAKGGIVVTICRQLQLPLLYVGVGESIEDLQRFDAKNFVEALF